MMPDRRQYVICTREGIKIFIDAEKGQAFSEDLVSGEIKGFVRIEGRTLNAVDITGIVFPEDIEDLTRRKNGEWQCQQGKWHERGRQCDCMAREEVERAEKIKIAIKNCGKCVSGYLLDDEGKVYPCKCWSEIK